MAFTRAEVEAALREFLPDRLSPSVSLTGELNHRALVDQTIALIVHAMIRDPDAPFRLRYLASEKLLGRLQGVETLLQELVSGSSGFRAIRSGTTPLVPGVGAVDDAEAALTVVEALVAAGRTPSAASNDFEAAVDQLLADLAPFVTGRDPRTLVDRLAPQVAALQVQTTALRANLDRFGDVEEAYRDAALPSILLAKLTSRVRDLLTETRFLLGRQDRRELGTEARTTVLQLAAAVAAVSETIQAAATAANVLVDSTGLPAAHVLEAQEWGRGHRAQTRSETPAVLEGSSGRIPRNAVVVSSITGYTEDEEGDTGPGTDPQAGAFSGYGPFELQLDSGVLDDVAWVATMDDGTTSAVFDHDGVGGVTGAQVVSGTIDYATGAVRDLVFSVSFSGATASVAYSRKANNRTNFFKDASAPFGPVSAGQILRVLVRGGPEDPGGTGYEDRFEILEKVSTSVLRIGKFGDGARLVEGGLPEPYTDIAYEVVSQPTTATFEVLDPVLEPLWTTKGVGVPFVGHTDAEDNLLTAATPPGTPLAMSPVRETPVTGTVGWVGPDPAPPGGFVEFFDDTRALGSLPDLHPDATASDLLVAGGFALVVTGPPAVPLGTYRIQRVLAGAEVSYELLDPIPDYGVAKAGTIGTGDGGTTYFFQATHTRLEGSTLTLTAGAQVVTDDGAGNLVGAGTGTIDYANGQIVVTFGAPVGVGVPIAYTYETRSLEYRVVPMSRLLEDGAGNFVEGCRRLRFVGATFQSDYAANPDDYPGPGDFLFTELRPNWLRIQSFVDEETVQVEMVRYQTPDDHSERWPIEYSGVASDTWFFRARSGASTHRDFHDESPLPADALTSYQWESTLIWRNTSDVFRSADYGVWNAANLAGWERVVLYPGTPQERRAAIVEVLDAQTVRLDVFLSDQLGVVAGAHDSQDFAVEDIVRTGDWLQTPLEADWGRFVRIEQVVSESELLLAEPLPDTLSARFPAGMDYRIVRSLEPTRLLDLVEDLGVSDLTAAGPLQADPQGLLPGTVPGPARSLAPIAVRPDYWVEVQVGGELRRCRLSGAQTGTQVLVDPPLPPWRPGLAWRVLRGGEPKSPLLRRATDFAADVLPGDRACFWSTSEEDVPTNERAGEPVAEAVVDVQLPQPLVSAAQADQVLRVDRFLPRFLQGYLVVHRGESHFTGRDTILSRLLAPLEAQVPQDFTVLLQQVNEVRIQQVADESPVLDPYMGAPSLHLDDAGRVDGLRSAPGDDWTVLGIEAGQLVVVRFTSPGGYPAEEVRSYVLSVDAREIVLDPPAAVPASDALGPASQYTFSQVSFFENDATPILQTLDDYLAVVSEMREAVEKYRSDRFGGGGARAAEILRLLQEAGMDRAKDLLLEGQIKDFFALTADDASYAVAALETGRALLRDLVGE